MLLIDDHTPPSPQPERRVWEPNLRLGAWVLVAVGTAVACFLTAGLVSLLLAFAAFGSTIHVTAIALPYGNGLRDHHQ